MTLLSPRYDDAVLELLPKGSLYYASNNGTVGGVILIHQLPSKRPWQAMGDGVVG